jgi:hypothetical protein
MPVAAPDATLPVTESVQSEVLFMHPPSQATWEIALPVTPTAATFWMGLSPEAETWWGDGVTFRVLVDGTEAFSHHLTAEQAQAGWRPAVADLSDWAGQTVRLTLATGAGPDGEGGGDWAGWGDVRILAGEAEAVPWAWVRAAWEEAGVTAEDLARAGEQAVLTERYEIANRLLTLYERSDAFPEWVSGQVFVIESFLDAETWRLCDWCVTTDVRFEARDGLLAIRYLSENKGSIEHNGFTFRLRSSLNCTEYRELLVRLRGEQGVQLTLETVIDGTRTRAYNYRSTPTEWQTWVLPVVGQELQEVMIKVSIQEVGPDHPELVVDWIGLR